MERVIYIRGEAQRGGYHRRGALIFMTDEENVLRDDVSELTITKKEALQNAPVKDSDYFKVPRVVDKG